MRICYLCADRGISLGKHNGASAHFRSLVAAFAALGHDVVVVTPSADGDLGVPVVRIPAPEVLRAVASGVDREQRRLAHALGHVWNNVLVEQTLREVVPKQRPDLLFEVYSPYGVAGGVMASRLGVRHLLNVHAPLAWEGKRYRGQALQEAAEALERVALDSASFVVTNTNELSRDLVAEGVPASKVAVVPNGVDVELFGPDGPAQDAGLEGKLVVGFVGSLKAWHGVDILVEAFRAVASDARFHLLVVGDGPMARALRALGDELPGRVTLTGAVPLAQVPSYVRAMDVAVAPYPVLERFYFSPLKVLEYMAAGRAVVASRIGQLVDLIDDGETGLLVPPGDATALADAVRTLAADPALRERLGARAAAEARRSHTWARRAREILEHAEATA